MSNPNTFNSDQNMTFKSITVETAITQRLLSIPKEHNKKRSWLMPTLASTTALAAFATIVSVSLFTATPSMSVAQELQAVIQTSKRSDSFSTKIYDSEKDAEQNSLPIAESLDTPNFRYSRRGNRHTLVKNGRLTTVDHSFKFKVVKDIERKRKNLSQFSHIDFLPKDLINLKKTENVMFRGKPHDQFTAQQVFEFKQESTKIPQTKFFKLLVNPDTNRVVYFLSYEPHQERQPTVISYDVKASSPPEMPVNEDYKVFDVQNDTKAILEAIKSKPQIAKVDSTTFRIYALILDFSAQATLIYSTDDELQNEEMFKPFFSIDGLQFSSDTTNFLSENQINKKIYPAFFKQPPYPFVRQTTFVPDKLGTVTWPQSPIISIFKSKGKDLEIQIDRLKIIKVFQAQSSLSSHIEAHKPRPE